MRFKDFDVERDCPNNKEAYDNKCYDCLWYEYCLGKYEMEYGR